MHLILTGATGLVGGAVLDAMLAMPEITRISILTRRPVPMLEDRIRNNDAVAADKDRVRVILHKDFSTYDDTLLQRDLRGAAGVVWALGISQLAVSKEDYVTITKDYTLAAAKAFQRIPADDATEPFRFVYVSGEGAATAPGITTQRFGRVKGEAELGLAALANAAQETTAAAGARCFQAVSVRPGGVDPAGHAALLPYAPPPPSALMRLTAPVLMPLVRSQYPGMISPTPVLGSFRAQLAMGKYDARIKTNTPPVPKVETVGAAFHILPNVAFRRLMGLDGQ